MDGLPSDCYHRCLEPTLSRDQKHLFDATLSGRTFAPYKDTYKSVIGFNQK
jgi:hypothetical protein